MVVLMQEIVVRFVDIWFFLVFVEYVEYVMCYCEVVEYIDCCQGDGDSGYYFDQQFGMGDVVGQWWGYLYEGVDYDD